MLRTKIDKPTQGHGQQIGVAGRCEEACLAVLNELPASSDVCGNGRPACRESFDEGAGNSFAVAGQNQRIAVCDDRWHGVLWHRAQEAHPADEVVRLGAAARCCLHPISFGWQLCPNNGQVCAGYQG